MEIAFCFNVKNTKPSKSLTAQKEAEFDDPETINDIEYALKQSGHKVIRIEADENAYPQFLKFKKQISIVYNIAEGLRGEAREAQIPAMLEMLNIPYTHSRVLTQAITLDKALTKKILHYHHINTPKFLLITDESQIPPDIDKMLTFPLFVKPNSEGSSKGIFIENLVFDKLNLKERIKWLMEIFKEPILVEEFASGREFTVALIGNNPPKILPIVEQNFAVFPENMPHFASYEAKWLFEDQLPNPHDAYFCPAPIDSKLKKEIEDICFSTWNALDLKDVARIDLRLDKNGHPTILEVNTMPGLISDPDIVSYLPIAARSAGYTFESLVNSILNSAIKRYGLEEKNIKTYRFTKQKALHLTKSK